jgi:uncharacterized protein with GYD domain
MPKYLISASYSAEGLKGLQKDKASGRRRAVTAAIEALGGKVEAPSASRHRRAASCIPGQPR